MNEFKKMLRTYVNRIKQIATMGDAREESFYPALEELLTEFINATNKKNSHVTVLPKKTDAGNPDFRIWDGKRRIVGYIEAKILEKTLDEAERTEQISRYNSIFPNFILTNFIEFRLYKNGSCVSKIRISDLKSIYSGKEQVHFEGEAEFIELMEKFFSFSQPSITTTEVLAIELAKRTRFLRDEVIAQEIEEEEKSGIKRILGFYDAFQTYLIKGLTKQQFADLYSQTITYGLFASRMRGGAEFNRKIAVYDIPHSIGILRDIFNFISLGDLPRQMEWIVDEISDVLANVDVKGIFSEYFKAKRGDDPVFPFYEKFLTEYDPEMRERRGVYYTPEPVVSYIVRSLNIILKEDFHLSDGLAEDNLTILDPAGGTLTFLAQAVKEAIKEFTAKYGNGGKAKFIQDHILPDFYAFELLVAPYAIGHLKMSFLLEEMGYKLQETERIKFYLTNTLEMEDIAQTSLPGMVSLSEESHFAGAVKKNTPILIILGNPPYSGHSENIGEWISEEVKEYYKVDGAPLGERNSKWLQDDYVKFIRFAQWKIDQSGKGVLGFIINHAYLNSPTFRGMRQSLLKSFEEIYVLNLHGNSHQKEICPDGSKDENVFDIQQGVSISLFVKKGEKTDVTKVHYADLWGLRHHKYDWLSVNDVKTTEWETLCPHSKEYLFIPRDETLIKRYEDFVQITDIFQIGSIAVQTHRDKLAVDCDKDRLLQRIGVFRDKKISDETICESLELKETDSWKIKDKRAIVREDNNWESRILEFAFRPFDTRWVFYHEAVIDRDRWKVMQNMLIPNNIGLNCMREYAYEVSSYNYAFVSGAITDDRIFVSNKGAAYFVPLYVFTNPRKERNLLTRKGIDKKSNINPSIVKLLEEAFGCKPSPEEIFYYIYAVLYSEVYRHRYEEFVKTNFPRIPLTKNRELFLEISQLGATLSDLHLLKSESLKNPISRFQGEGDNSISKPFYDPKNCRVYVNKSQYFEAISTEVWNYQIGGYQVMFHWLKNKDARMLSLEDIKQYCRIATALTQTIETQGKIDKIYLKTEKNVIKNKKKTPTTNLKDYS
jgi:hypothetical protein